MRNSLEHALTNSLDPLIGTNISRVIESGKVKILFLHSSQISTVITILEYFPISK